MKKSILLLPAILVLFACKKEKEFPTTPMGEITLETLKPNSNIDYLTSNTIELSLTGYAESTVEILDSKGNLYQKALLKRNEAETFVVRVPNHETKLVMKYMGHTVELEVKNNKLQHTFN